MIRRAENEVAVPLFAPSFSVVSPPPILGPVPASHTSTNTQAAAVQAAADLATADQAAA